MSSTRCSLLGFLAALLLGGPAFGGFFTTGNLVVDQVGNGTSTLNSAATQTSLVQYTTSGGLVNSLAMPTIASGSNLALTNSGSATSEGALALSSNGQYLTLAGYNAAVGTAGVASTSTTGAGAVSRVIGLIDASGNINTSTQITDGYSANNIRGAVTTNGSIFYTSGTSGSSGGTREVALGSSGASIQISSTVTNTRVVEIINGQLYTSSASGSNIGINTVSTGVPTTGGQTTTLITTSGATNAYGFVILGNNLYVADATAGLEKFVYNATNNNYNLVSTTSVGFAIGLTGLTGTIGSNGDDLLYAVNPTQLIAFDDNGSSISSSILATASPNTAFRGIAFAPTANVSVPEPASIAMTSLGTICVTAFAVRRKLQK